MTTPHTIPVSVLIRAISALKAAKDSPVSAPISHSTWAAALHAHSELTMHVEILVKDLLAVVDVPAHG